LRGFVVGPAHSVGCRAQNSAHPKGGCVISDTETWASHLLAGTASIVLTINIAITTVTNFAFNALEITVFAPPLHSALRNATRTATLETQAIKFGGYRRAAPGHH
jgi:hypothetical protein